ncbi:MAG: hypothetical protein EXR94_05990 [Gemmatimonadetes bacterium]|nr:hypothetical protein [Gemmatimonadota bacterium]
MPDIAVFHPQLVHFAMVLGIVGVLFRLISLTGKAGWTNSAAAAMLIAAGAVGYATAESGDQAHGPVERIPGAVKAVQEHEEWGNRARNMLLLVGAIELIGLAFRKHKSAAALRLVSGLAGIGAVFALYEAGEHGGELVYSYAGGPGLRSGDTTDVTRLLVAGLYNRAMADRAAGDADGAARLIDELARRMPNDLTVKLTVIESQIKDRQDAAGALVALHAFDPGDDRRSQFRKVFLLADAYKASGSVDSARAVLEAFKAANPTAAERIDQAIKALMGTTP